MTIIAKILSSCNISKKRDPKTRVDIEPPWMDYGEFVIVSPGPWELDITPRSSEWIKLLLEKFFV
jgi:hypothetical protein